MTANIMAERSSTPVAQTQDLLPGEPALFDLPNRPPAFSLPLPLPALQDMPYICKFTHHRRYQH